MARAEQTIEDHDIDRRALWWGMVWIAANIGSVVVLVLLAAA